MVQVSARRWVNRHAAWTPPTPPVGAERHWTGNLGASFMPWLLCDRRGCRTEPQFLKGLDFVPGGPLMALRPGIWEPMVRIGAGRCQLARLWPHTSSKMGIPLMTSGWRAAAVQPWSLPLSPTSSFRRALEVAGGTPLGRGYGSKVMALPPRYPSVLNKVVDCLFKREEAPAKYPAFKIRSSSPWPSSPTPPTQEAPLLRPGLACLLPLNLTPPCPTISLPVPHSKTAPGGSLLPPVLSPPLLSLNFPFAPAKRRASYSRGHFYFGKTLSHLELVSSGTEC